MKTLKKYDSFNHRRYGNPWVAIVSKDGKIDFNRKVGGYTGAGITYRIMTAFDAARLAEHEKCVADAAEAFWQEEHARRTAKAAAV